MNENNMDATAGGTDKTKRKLPTWLEESQSQPTGSKITVQSPKRSKYSNDKDNKQNIKQANKETVVNSSDTDQGRCFSKNNENFNQNIPGISNLDEQSNGSSSSEQQIESNEPLNNEQVQIKQEPNEVNAESNATQQQKESDEPLNNEQVIIKQEPNKSVLDDEAEATPVVLPSPIKTEAEATPVVLPSPIKTEVKKERLEENEPSSSTAGSIKTEPSKKIVAVVNPIVKQEATSSTPSRPSCKFGITCYRRNVLHRDEEAHPGDSDYRRPVYPEPPEGTPMCPFAHLCYRRNPNHFTQFSHPPSTDFKKNWQNRQNRLRDRKDNVSYRMEDSDEYESDFIDDSTEEYEPGDGKDDDSEDDLE